MQDQPLLYTVARVAELLSLSENAVWRFVRTGELKSFKLGRSRRIHADDLADFIKVRSG